MNTSHSILLGIVEALTEFLPVSSTGHLILFSKLLGLENNDFVKTFEVVIQAGAMFAVMAYYRKFLVSKAREALHDKNDARNFFKNIAIAFFPAAFIGFFFHKLIKVFLFGATPVIIALIVGGVVMVYLERKWKTESQNKTISQMTPKDALVVGCWQILSLWPGTSRAMTTLMGARSRGLSHHASAEFSFILAIPILLAASLLDVFKSWSLMVQNTQYVQLLLIGMIVSFGFSLVVIHLFLSYLKRHSLEIFGWYRIVIGIFLLILGHI
jgi:undecaprenyl-diphosphatase